MSHRLAGGPSRWPPCPHTVGRVDIDLQSVVDGTSGYQFTKADCAAQRGEVAATIPALEAVSVDVAVNVLRVVVIERACATRCAQCEWLTLDQRVAIGCKRCERVILVRREHLEVGGDRSIDQQCARGVASLTLESPDGPAVFSTIGVSGAVGVMTMTC